MTNFYNLGINLLGSGKSSQATTPLEASRGFTDEEKYVADKLAERFKDSAWLEERRLIRVSFDVKVKRNKIEVCQIYLTPINGSTVSVPFNHIIPLTEQKSTTPKTKGVVAMNNLVAKDLLVTKIVGIALAILTLLFGVSIAFPSIPKEVSVIGSLLSLGCTVAVFAFDKLFRRYFE